MAKPGRRQEIEQEWGESGETLLPRLLNEYGSIPKVAPVVGMGFDNLYLWCKDIGVVKEIVWTIQKPAATHDPA